MQFALAFVPVLVLISLIGFLLPVLFRLMRSSKSAEFTTDWFDNFQVSNYRPMQGLLAPDDFQFLSRQPGFDQALFDKLRHDRLRIFRQYLNRLITDYNRLYTLAGFVISQSGEDQSPLYARLLSLRFRFWLAIVQVEFRYLLCRFALCPLSIGRLLQQMEQISALALLPSARPMLRS